MRFRKKPVVIDAWEWDETRATLELLQSVGMVTSGCIGHRDRPGWVGDLRISTLEGPLHASKGDWIIKGVNGEFYPCKPDIFAKTYEPEDNSGR